MNIAPELRLDAMDFVGKSVALLGITGSGKTNTAAVIIEELERQGLPMTIVDIEGEYWGLKQSFDFLIAGRSEHAELEVTLDNASALAQTSVSRGLSVILDLSDYTQEETYEFLVSYFSTLWETASKVKRPYMLVLEEAHEFVPQGQSTPLKQILTRIALRGRKRGLGTILMSQRSAKVEKDVLTQASLLFLHKVVHPTDMRVYNDLIPLPTKEVEQLVGNLTTGQVIVISNHTPQIAHIRLRDTFHAGSTPALEGNAQPELRHVDAALLKELQAAIAVTKPDTKEESKLHRAERRIKELETLVTDLQEQVSDKDKQIALLSQLSVSMNGTMKSDVRLPETMQIERATIDRMEVQHEMQVPVPVVDAVPTTMIPQKASTQEIPRGIQEHFQRFKTRLARLDSIQYQVLHLLDEHNTALTAREIAMWLGIGVSTFNSHMTTTFVARSGLIKKHGFQYSSLIKQEIAKNFPQEYVPALIAQVWQ